MTSISFLRCSVVSDWSLLIFGDGGIYTDCRLVDGPLLSIFCCILGEICGGVSVFLALDRFLFGRDELALCLFGCIVDSPCSIEFSFWVSICISTC